MDMKYNIEDLNVGDEVYFENKYLENYGLYWQIVSKNTDGSITVDINEMGSKDRIAIQIEDIRIHTAIKNPPKVNPGSMNIEAFEINIWRKWKRNETARVGLHE